MMVGDAMAVVEASRDAECDEWDPLVHPEWTMPAGWLTLLVGLCLGTCVAAGVLTQAAGP